MGIEVVVDAREALADVVLHRFEATARTAIAARGRFACALPGGSVAEAFLPRLAGAAVDWSRTDLFWGDERAVPPTDPDANYGLARRLLLDRIPIGPAHVHRIHGEEPDLEAAAAAYARELAGTIGARPLDLVLLGMGPDGHVCSLFPDHAALGESVRTVVAIHDSPKPPPARITLTLVPLTGAALVCVAAFGTEKAAAVRAALEVPDSRLPVALAARAGAHALFLLDRAAASGLRDRSRVGPSA
jgi:6-phosphogluconolactonase